MFRIHKGVVYCSPIDDPTLNQFRNCLQPNWVNGGALMPDAHLGYDMPIGGVVSTERVVVPSWVGYDIGCGVCTVPLAVRDPQLVHEFKVDIHRMIMSAVPMGFKKHDDIQDDCPNPMGLTQLGRDAFYSRGGYDQFGTLGGGNHFIELGEDSHGNYYLTIHSGSRGTGHEVGKIYMDFAKAEGHGEKGTYGFAKGTTLYNNYLNDMTYCTAYALKNRIAMLKIIEESLQHEVDCRIEWGELINKSHNHADVLGDGSVIHRKGATSARIGEWGVIPGNMRDGVAVVKGLGNPDSYHSCSHGAGRKSSRSKAKKTLKLEDFEQDMTAVTCNVSEKHLDESPRAYKDFYDVMAKQDKLCEVYKYIKPLINWKA